jgi:Na+/melibiose symporter-like transporter
MKLALKKRSQRDLSKPFVRNIDMFAIGIGDLGYSIVSCTAATYITSFGTMALPGVSDIGFTATLMAIAVGIAVLFDAISDPIMGFISDNYNNKVFGKRHLFMLIGLIGMMASSIAIWYIPYDKMNAAGIFVWFAVFLILIRTFNTMYYTPVGAFSVEISNDYNERTTIQVIRSVLYIVGMLLPVVLMGMFQNKYAGIYDANNTLIAHGKDAVTALQAYAQANGIDLGNMLSDTKTANDNATTEITSLGYVFRKGQQVPDGYRDFALLGTAVCAVCSAFMLLVTRRYIKVLRVRDEKKAAEEGIDLNAPKVRYTRAGVRAELESEPHEGEIGRLAVRKRLQEKRAAAGQITMGGVLRNFFGAFKVKEMRTLAIGYTVAMMSATLIISLGFNVFTFTFQLQTTQMYVLMGGLLVMTIGCQPLWVTLAKKKSKQFSMLTGLIISFVGCVLIFVCFLFRDNINALVLDVDTTKSWLGAMILLPALMVAGCGTGVLYSMPLALVGDIVVLQNNKTHGDKTGTYAGVMTFCYKAGQGIVTAVSTALLDTIGFRTGEATQTASAATGMGWILCIGIIVFVGCGIAIISRLKLDRNKISEILSEQGAEMKNAEETIMENSNELDEAAATKDE